MVKKLDIKNDLVFKLFFCKEKNKPLLILFLESVLNLNSSIKNVTVLNANVLSNFIEEKNPVLDVLVELTDGKKVDIEMQMNPEKGFRSRILYYWARLHQSQLKKSDRYADIFPTYSISILNFVEFIEDPKKIHSVFKIKEVEKNYPFCDDLELHFLELKKYDQWKINLPSEKERSKKENSILNWVSFFNFSNLNEEDEKYLQLAKDTNMNKALKALDELSSDPEVQTLIDAREKNEINLKLINGSYYKEGREQGIEEGIEKGIKESILKMSKKGQTPEQISNLLDLDLEKVKSIISAN